MFITETKLNKDDFKAVDLKLILNESKMKSCDSYSAIFFNKAKQTDEDNIKEIYELLAWVTSFHLDVEKKDNPFGPKSISYLGKIKSADVVDINNSYLKFLSGIYSDINDNELKARISDILWVTSRDYKAALAAIDSYLESAKLLEDPKHWVPSYQRIKRALQLSAFIRRKNGAFDKVIKNIEELLLKLDGNDPSYFSCKLMFLLYDFKKGDSNKYALLSEKCAQKAELEQDYTRAYSYWEIQSKWYSLIKDNEKEKLALINSAETNVKEAEKAKDEESRGYIVAAHFIGKAIMMYRNIPNSKGRIEELTLLLLEYQKKALKEMKTVSTKFDVSSYVKEAQLKVKGKSIHDAFLLLAMITSPPRFEELRKRATQIINDNPITHLFSSVVVNQWGRVTGNKPSAFANNQKEIEMAIKCEMYEYGRMEQNIISQALIIPAIEQILSEHYVQKEDLYPLVYNNPFIPQGREMIYIEGLLAGVRRDYLISTHLLIPQLENSIREIIYKSGAVASGFDSDGIQDEHNLNSLLYRDDVKTLLGEDIVFDLQGLLVERFGSNLRNAVVHGLVNYDLFLSSQCIYLWWIVLRICFMPILNKLTKERDIDKQT